MGIGGRFDRREVVPVIEARTVVGTGVAIGVGVGHWTGNRGGDWVSGRGLAIGAGGGSMQRERLS